MTDFTYRIVNRFFRTVFWVLGLRIEVIGAEHIPAHGPAVLATAITSATSTSRSWSSQHHAAHVWCGSWPNAASSITRSPGH